MQEHQEEVTSRKENDTYTLGHGRKQTYTVFIVHFSHTWSLFNFYLLFTKKYYWEHCCLWIRYERSNTAVWPLTNLSRNRTYLVIGLPFHVRTSRSSSAPDSRDSIFSHERKSRRPAVTASVILQRGMCLLAVLIIY